jgi:hypothetical protein
VNFLREPNDEALNFSKRQEIEKLQLVQQLLRKRKGESKNEKAISIVIGSNSVDGSHYGACNRRLHNDGKGQNDDDERWPKHANG